MSFGRRPARTVTPPRLLAGSGLGSDPSPHSDGNKPGGPVLVCYHILAVAPAPHPLRRPATKHPRRHERRSCGRRECGWFQVVANHAVLGLGHVLRLGVLGSDGGDLLAVVLGNGCRCIDRHAGGAQRGDSARQEGTAPLAPFPRSFIHIPNFIGMLQEDMKVDALAARPLPGFLARPR